MRTFTKRTFLLGLVILASCVLDGVAQSVPSLINYQGRLTDAGGSPLPNGTYGVAFRIWAKKATSEPGDALIWGREYSVAVQSGVFNVILGASGGTQIANASVTDIVSAFSEAERYIGLTIIRGTNGAVISGAVEMVPRQQVLSAPYAVRAQVATSLTTSAVPSGLISLWSGSISSIPSGWALCDGLNGTPDLRDRFVVGARQDQGGIPMTNVKNSLMQTGGAHEVTLTVEQIPPHTHSYNETPWTGSRYDGSSSPLMTSQRSATTGSTGGGQAHENCPPFYALAYIMKL